MDWKEFFRLTKGKVIISSILLFLSFLFLIGGMGGRACSEFTGFTGSCPQLWYIRPSQTLFFTLGVIVVGSLALIGTGIFRPFDSIEIAIIVLGSLINILYLYFLSCLIVHIYPKIRKE